MLIDLAHMEEVLIYIRTHKKCRVIHHGREIFSSHTIIRVYCKLYDHEIVSWIVDHRRCNQVFQTVHSQIGRDLADNQRRLGIKKVDRITSLTVHHTDDKPMWWEWVK